jgi:CrcB protein
MRGRSFIMLSYVWVSVGGAIGSAARFGVCGGHTTFSSFSLQTLALAQDGEWFRAAGNAVASFVRCLFAVWFGHFSAWSINKP